MNNQLKAATIAVILLFSGCRSSLLNTVYAEMIPLSAELYIRETIQPEEVQITEGVVADVEMDGFSLAGLQTEMRLLKRLGLFSSEDSDSLGEDEEGVTEDLHLDDPIIDESEPEHEHMEFYGACTITHYCNCASCCGQWAGGPTASGAMPQAGVTVAADLPFGTELMINGNRYVVQDRGVSGMWIDIYCGSHSEALSKGMYTADVYIIG